MHTPNHVYLKGEGHSLSRVFSKVADASTEDRDLRIVTGVTDLGTPYLMLKVGEGMWSAPIYSDEDPNRD